MFSYILTNIFNCNLYLQSWKVVNISEYLIIFIDCMTTAFNIYAIKSVFFKLLCLISKTKNKIGFYYFS